MTICFSHRGFGQNFPNELVDSFCNETIDYYYTDFAKPLDSIEARNYLPNDAYILKSDLTKNLKTNFNQFTVRYLTQQEALAEISKTDSKTGALEKIFVTQLQDTVNIDIGGWAIRVTKVKFVKGQPRNIHANFAASCGGTLGYIPTCRFVYNRETSSWRKFTWTEIAHEKMKQRESASE